LLAELESQGRNQNQQMRRLFELSEEIIRGQVQTGINIEGKTNLANNPEFKAPEKLEEVLRLLEDQQILLDLLDQSLAAPGIRVIIGQEHPYPAMRELTMISASYASRSGKPIGSIGVIGPRRMDYEKLISLVSYIAGRISEFLRVH
jgi:heat-inducible transcriptional repressor